MVKILEDYFAESLNRLNVLNVGGSSGIIDNYLAHHFSSVTGIDIDEAAIHHAQENFKKSNLQFQTGDAMNLEFEGNHFDVVICSHVYEHVPNAEVMFAEIYRVLKPSGICYFTAGNRLIWHEPHHHLPLLSVLPRPFAHFYLRLTKKGNYYYEKHLTYWGLKRLVKKFECFDYTKDTIYEPDKYATGYMVKSSKLVNYIALFTVKYCYWICPGYIWLLKKEDLNPG
ncbi:MAG: class I SAM-dependent methyltransferase [Methylococcaceae bacterium]